MHERVSVGVKGPPLGCGGYPQGFVSSLVLLCFGRVSSAVHKARFGTWAGGRCGAQRLEVEFVELERDGGHGSGQRLLTRLVGAVKGPI